MHFNQPCAELHLQEPVEHLSSYALSGAPTRRLSPPGGLECFHILESSAHARRHAQPRCDGAWREVAPSARLQHSSWFRA
jgi:hypothetical protein